MWESRNREQLSVTGHTVIYTRSAKCICMGNLVSPKQQAQHLIDQNIFQFYHHWMYIKGLRIPALVLKRISCKCMYEETCVTSMQMKLRLSVSLRKRFCGQVTVTQWQLNCHGVVHYPVTGSVTFSVFVSDASIHKCLHNFFEEKNRCINFNNTVQYRYNSKGWKQRQAKAWKGLSYMQLY